MSTWSFLLQPQVQTKWFLEVKKNMKEYNVDDSCFKIFKKEHVEGQSYWIDEDIGLTNWSSSRGGASWTKSCKKIRSRITPPTGSKENIWPIWQVGTLGSEFQTKKRRKKTCKNTLFCLWLFLFLLNYLSLGPKPKSISWVAEDLWNSNHSTQIHSAQKHPSQSLAVPNHRVALQGAHQHVFEGVSSRNSPEIWHFSEENDMFMCHRWSVIILTYSQVSS